MFLFLPLVLLINPRLPGRFQNAFLFLMSLLFYGWAGPHFVLLLLGSIAFNWVLGLGLTCVKGARIRGLCVGFGVGMNLIPLLYFKYAGLGVNLANFLARPVRHDLFYWPAVVAPLGISFYTFHAISYLVDIHRGRAQPFRSPLDLGLYFAFFPQLIAGPIIRYYQISDQISRTRPSGNSASCIRFTQGLAKKVLIADPLGAPVEHVFSLSPSDLSSGAAWYGIICYTIQIYFDFSGYSDMAIGLAGMLGFSFPENFSAPYSATSVRDFWRRWHISLSNWFRDYLYIPLGGNRRSSVRVSMNLLLVFLLCGLWHGAAFPFLAWGLYHGFFLSLERGRWGEILAQMPAPIARAATFLIVVFGWGLFRSPTLAQAGFIWKAMLGFGSLNSYAGGIQIYHSPQIHLSLGIAVVLLAFEWFPIISPKNHLGISRPTVAGIAWMSALLFLSSMYASANSSHPFLYFQF
ncbi:MAG: MBOAT family O-acyltransferase [Bdellovibrionota bacterium]